MHCHFYPEQLQSHSKRLHPAQNHHRYTISSLCIDTRENICKHYRRIADRSRLINDGWIRFAALVNLIQQNIELSTLSASGKETKQSLNSDTGEYIDECMVLFPFINSHDRYNSPWQLSEDYKKAMKSYQRFMRQYIPRGGKPRLRLKFAVDCQVCRKHVSFVEDSSVESVTSGGRLIHCKDCQHSWTCSEQCMLVHQKTTCLARSYVPETRLAYRGPFPKLVTIIPSIIITRSGS